MRNERANTVDRKYGLIGKTIDDDHGLTGEDLEKVKDGYTYGAL